VTVTRDEDRVLDLRREDFTVRDDGETQSLVTFEQGSVPMTALLLIDASESMRGRRLDTALAGARSFLRGLASLDQAALWLFSDRLLYASPVTGFAEVLEAGLSRVEARGGTALNDHLYLALRELDRHQGRRVVVVLSDGVDVASVLSMEQVREASRRTEAMVYWIRPDPPRAGQRSYRSAWRDEETYRREQAALEALVATSGGRVVSLEDREQVPAAFTAVLEEIREQYVLGYYPTRNRDDGSWHRIQVRVGGSGLDVRVREGYLDE
jgi:Ca-activated chloride channel family protein